jgi:transcriptional regulator with XRE-family HTH domain
MTEGVGGFNRELRRRRNEKKLSLAALSGRVFCSPSHLSKVETGKAKASPSLGRLCDDALEANGELTALLGKIEKCEHNPPRPSHFTASPLRLLIS